MLKEQAAERLVAALGTPTRNIEKVKAWDLTRAVGLVLQMDQPRARGALIWLPHPGDGGNVPEIALEYPAEAGRHSNTYASPGLGRGRPALKLRIGTTAELEGVIAYALAMAASTPLPAVAREAPADAAETTAPIRVDPAAMPEARPIKPRREAIPRLVQREVWQRDGGVCVQCASRERLCFDHIVPFSRGGGNSVRNIQLLCEPCNLGKGNRL